MTEIWTAERRYLRLHHQTRAGDNGAANPARAGGGKRPWLSSIRSLLNEGVVNK